MSRFQVSFSTMRACAQELQELNKQFCKSVGSICEKKQQLCSMWQGDANTAFSAAFENDHSQWDVFATLINGYCATLLQIAQIYEQAEQQNASIAGTRSYGGGGGSTGISPKANLGLVDSHLPNITMMYGSPNINQNIVRSELSAFNFNFQD